MIEYNLMGTSQQPHGWTAMIKAMPTLLQNGNNLTRKMLQPNRGKAGLARVGFDKLRGRKRESEIDREGKERERKEREYPVPGSVFSYIVSQLIHCFTHKHATRSTCTLAGIPPPITSPRYWRNLLGALPTITI